MRNSACSVLRVIMGNPYRVLLAVARRTIRRATANSTHIWLNIDWRITTDWIHITSLNYNLTKFFRLFT